MGGKIYTELTGYYCGSSGDMIGSSYSEKVRALDDKYALITISKAEAHNVEPTITEYKVDIKILSEIRDVFVKYKMYKWDGMTFTNMFVSDGATTHYSFDFGDKSISFYSQIFPEPYSSKLEQIDDIVEKYKKVAK